jgi:hypothetical protein
MFGNSFNPNRSNLIIGIALAISVLAFCRFVAALIGTATEGEVAGALGGFVGGVRLQVGPKPPVRANEKIRFECTVIE